MKTYNHACIKVACSNTYKDEDPDAYYCSACKEMNKKIAQEVDAKLATMPKRKVVSALQEYDNAEKVRGFMPVKL